MLVCLHNATVVVWGEKSISILIINSKQGFYLYIYFETVLEKLLIRDNINVVKRKLKSKINK